MRCVEIATRVRQYVMQNFLYARPGQTLSDEDRLFEDGILDPADIWEIIGFLKSDFGVVVQEGEIGDENFGTVGAITEYVCARRAPESRY